MADYPAFTPIMDGADRDRVDDPKKGKSVDEMTKAEIYAEVLQQCEVYAAMVEKSRSSIAKLIRIPLIPAAIIAASIIFIAIKGNIPKELVLTALSFDAFWAFYQLMCGLHGRTTAVAHMNEIHPRLKSMVDRDDADAKLQDAFIQFNLDINHFRS